MKSRNCILPGLAKYRKDGENSPFQKNPIKKIKTKIKEFKDFKKKQQSKHNIIKATVPDIPIGPGNIKKSKNLLDAFNRVAKNRAAQNKILEESLKKKGYTFVKKKK